MTQRMILNETSWFGRGCRSQLINELTRRGFSRALIVTDNGLVKCGIVEKITTLLDKAGFAWSLFDRVVPNPGITVVQEGVEKFRSSGADVLIAIGGGSPQDTCKAIGIIINNPEFADVRSLEGVAETTRPCVPIIALPTTAGTAAEVTINYVITDEENQRKFFDKRRYARQAAALDTRTHSCCSCPPLIVASRASSVSPCLATHSPKVLEMLRFG